MLLLSVREWSGQAAQSASVLLPNTEKLIGLVTRQPLGEALKQLRAHERWYRAKYFPRAVNFNLVAVSQIDDLPLEVLQAARLEDLDYLEI